MAEQQLAGRVAIVTGSGRGLGASIARKLAAAGATVVVSDVRDEDGEAVAAGIRADGGDARFAHLDVTDEAQWAQVIALCDELGGLRVLVSNAFRTTLGGIEDETLDGWHQTLGVTLTGAFLAMHHAVPAMKRAGGGAIVAISSIHGGAVADDGRVAYQAAKGGVSALTRAVAISCARDGIRANVITPGPIDTPVVAELGFEAEQAAFAATLPLGRQADPDEIAEVALFLASDASSFMTGASVAADGGFTAR
jgi:NAD(P)-dependent dehydrogenase (short-subunit alcohol dehydrogenase family)